MSLAQGELRPIEAGDDELRGHVAEADLLALLMALASLTGDVSILRDDLRPNLELYGPGPFTADQQRLAREIAVERLIAYRNAGCPAPRPPGRELVERIVGWALGQPPGDDLAELLTEELVLADEDLKAPRWHASQFAPGRDVRVAIIGAGMSGLLAAHRLSQAGIPFVIYEKDDEVGGTWRDNRYPGCRVDVANHLYSYSFEVKHDWPDYYCRQDVLLAYFQAFADRHDLRRHIRFGTEVRSAAWDEDAGLWRLKLDGRDGPETTDAQVLVSAVGQLNRPYVPDIEGAATFVGRTFHSASWDEDVDLTGRRVAVVGTGASAFQIIPAIAEQTAALVVFQRTPPWLLPTPNYQDAVSTAKRWLFEHVPGYTAWYRFSLFMPGLQGLLEAVLVDPDHGPTEESISALNAQFRGRLLAALEAQLEDTPELHEHVIPRYPVGAKRMLKDNGAWLRTFKRDDVTLVTAGIERITPRGIVGADGTEHVVDVIVYATGFRASEFLMPMTVTGRDGIDLHEMWDEDARAYLGATIPGFPNLFCLYGPNTNLVIHGGGIIFFSECVATYLLSAIRLLLERDAAALEVRPEVFRAYNERIDAANAMTAWGWSSVSTWYRNAKGRSAQNWPLPALEFWKRTHDVDRAEYDLVERPPATQHRFGDLSR